MGFASAVFIFNKLNPPSLRRPQASRANAKGGAISRRLFAFHYRRGAVPHHRWI